ncbi:MAG: hypothetical protein GXP55_17040 [Deltaproteobacteria bacterium]|nr:hypothetical protein [Deltaproteobacteria bacterium]
MGNDTSAKSRIIRTLFGGALGFVLHMIFLGGAIAVMQVGSLMAGTSRSAEGSFWALVLAFLFSPAGITVGAITGFAGSKKERSGLQVALFGVVPSVLGGMFVAVSFLLVYDDANFVIGAIVGFFGVLISVVIAALSRAKPPT